MNKPKQESHLHHIRVDIPTIVRTFYAQHAEKVLNILKYVQTVGLVNTYHALGIDLLAEAAVNDQVWKTENDFTAEELDLSNTLTKELKPRFVSPLKEPSWIVREWDELMAFIINGRHLYEGPLTAEDIEKEQQMPGGFKESSSKSKGRDPVTSERVQGSTRQQRSQQPTVGRDKVEKEAQYEAHQKRSDRNEDANTTTTSAPSGPLADS